MKIFYRFLTKRVVVNNYGKLGYREHIEIVNCTEEQLKIFNKGLRIKFTAVDATYPHIQLFISKKMREEGGFEAAKIYSYAC